MTLKEIEEDLKHWQPQYPISLATDVLLEKHLPLLLQALKEACKTEVEINKLLKSAAKNVTYNCKVKIK